jgi:hypothetical protein
MVWRVAHEAIGDQVGESERQPAGLEINLDTIDGGRVSLSDRQHAHRDQRAILTAFVLLLVRTARHVAGHRGHIGHLCDRQPCCRRGCHQRRNNEPNDHKDREQMTDESAKIHDLPSHGTGDLGRQIHFTSLPDRETRSKAPKIHAVSSGSRLALLAKPLVKRFNNIGKIQ